MNEDELQQPSSILFCLPLHIIEKIVRLLVNQKINQNKCFVQNNFSYWLSDVLNLRATCVYMVDVVNNTGLKLPWAVELYEPEFNRNINSFLDFMMTKTFWKFSTLTFPSDCFQFEIKTEFFLAQYRDLFENTISRLKLHVPQSASPLIVRNITAYFKQRCRYLVRFDDPPVQISEPDRAIVDDLVVYDFEPVECFLTDGFLKGYSNLSSLEMFSELPIEKLPLLANLRKLSVGDVSFPNISRQSWLCFMFLFAFLNYLSKFSQLKWFLRGYYG